MPDISVIVVTWNSASTITTLLDSLHEAAGTTSTRLQVIVIDNASSDNTVELVRGHQLTSQLPTGPTTVLIVNRTNRGLAAANNQGMLAATAPYYLICNPDAIPTAAAISALVDCAERRPRAAFVLAKLLHPDGSLQPGVGALPTLHEALAGRGAEKRRSGATGMWWDGWPHDEETKIGHGNEACYLVRRQAALEIGPQDENYILDWEGFDWAARAADAGWEVWFCPTAEVVHIGGVSIRQANQARWMISTHRGMYRYFSRRTSPALRPLLAATISARLLLKLAGHLARRDSYSRAHGGG